MKKLLLFLIGLIFGVYIFRPNLGLAQNATVKLSAIVLETITVSYNQKQYLTATNYRGGYWQLNNDHQIIVVARY